MVTERAQKMKMPRQRLEKKEVRKARMMVMRRPLGPPRKGAKQSDKNLNMMQLQAWRRTRRRNVMKMGNVMMMMRTTLRMMSERLTARR